VRYAKPLQETPRGGILSGLSIALATAFKLTPGIFGIYFLWSWRKWSMLGGALGLVLFLFLVPSSLLGWETNNNYLKTYAEYAAGKTKGDQHVADDPDRIII